MARQSLSKLCDTLENIEFDSDADVTKYARTLQQIGIQLHMQVAMDADLVKGILESYTGQWYEFGVGSKLRARAVAAYLKIGAEACKILATSGVRMNAAFRKHFVEPEIAARRAKTKSGKSKGKTFKIDGT